MTDQSNPSKVRNLLWDDHGLKFYWETPYEAMQRKALKKENDVLANNRSEAALLQREKDRVDTGCRLYTSKFTREKETYRDSLKEYIAHKNVLERVMETNMNDQTRNENFGQYGLNKTSKDLRNLIEDELHRMHPVTKRKRKVEWLAKTHERIGVFDRTMTFAEIVASRKPKDRTPARLILPPVTAGYSSRRTCSNTNSGTQSTHGSSSTVFVTQLDDFDTNEPIIGATDSTDEKLTQNLSAKSVENGGNI
ncbi:unnamed protein product, partial [Owenia fusiformis]